ncbi:MULTISPECIES: CBS domain-containing protein [unclassified Microcoleus]|uniref:CBS domain-containing protein n=1 Tax=unclassified Microcoleus TaxID=2642155 RepID=UPI002FD292FE
MLNSNLPESISPTLQSPPCRSFPLMPLQVKATLWQAHQFMQQHRIRRLVVVDEGGYLAGIVTQSTLLHALDPVEIHANAELLQETVAKNI